MDKNKTTLVMGASNDPSRYAYKAVKRLESYGHKIIAFGNTREFIGDIPVENDWNTTWDVHTVTLYLNPRNQKDYIDPIIGLKPERVIFNPGTENPEFTRKLAAAGIDYEFACTLVMLSTGEY